MRGSKQEFEVKVLDIDVKRTSDKLEALGAERANSGIQKIFVYDLLPIGMRYELLARRLAKTHPHSHELVAYASELVDEVVDNLSSTDFDRMKEATGTISPEILRKQVLDGLLSRQGRRKQSTRLTDALLGLPASPNKWVRLRQTGMYCSIAVKQIRGRSLVGSGEFEIGAMRELEVPVPSLEIGLQFLEALGFVPRNYQEKRRTTYLLNGTRFDFDEWPVIPPYLEIEGLSRTAVFNAAYRLGIAAERLESIGAEDVFARYGVDLLSVPELRFGE